MSDQFVFNSDLGETSLAETLATIHRYRVHGVLDVEAPDVTKKLFILDGDIIFASSSKIVESLGDFLLEQGKITKAEYQVSVAELKRTGKRHGNILVEMGFLPMDELGAAVREQVESVLWSMFDIREAKITFSVGRFKGDETFQLKIPTPRAIITGCKHISDGRWVTKKLGSKSTTFRRKPLPPHLDALVLDEGETGLFQLVNGKRSLIELCEHGPFAPGMNARVLFALRSLLMIEKLRATQTGIKIKISS